MILDAVEAVEHDDSGLLRAAAMLKDHINKKKLYSKYITEGCC